MLITQPIADLGVLTELKSRYFQQATMPLDGMWHMAFAVQATHFGFYWNDALIGFCCVNSTGQMLEYFVSDEVIEHSAELFGRIIRGEDDNVRIKSCLVSTSEPAWLALCMDHNITYTVNTVLYHQYHTELPTLLAVELSIVTPEQQPALVAFANETIGAPEAWLNFYYGNLIQRGELWAHWDGDRVLAAGECRRFDEHQTDWADLGIIVAKESRGQGLAARVLNALIHNTNEQGLKAMSSTEQTNTAAQKAIARAGLIAKFRMVEFPF